MTSAIQELQDLLADLTQKSKVVLREDSKRGKVQIPVYKERM